MVWDGTEAVSSAAKKNDPVQSDLFVPAQESV